MLDTAREVDTLRREIADARQARDTAEALVAKLQAEVRRLRPALRKNGQGRRKRK
jgi:hypothetical protein